MRADLNRCDFLYIFLKRGLALYLLMLFFMTIGRVVFVAYFSPPGLYEEFATDIAKAFFMGWRYDTIVASYLLAPYALLSILVSLTRSRKVSRAFFKLSFVFYFLAIIAVLFFVGSDLGFYSYFQDHLNILFFGMIEDDVQALALTIWKNYPVGILGVCVLALFSFVFFCLKWIFSSLENARSLFQPGVFKHVFMSLLAIVLLFGGARGGFGDFVLSPKYADFSKDIFVNQIALNGMITFEQAFKMRRSRSSASFSMEKAMGYKKGIHEAFSDFLGVDTSPTDQKHLVNLLERRTPYSEELKEKRPHVVVFVMESFGGSWGKYNSESFNFLGPLKSHLAQDITFENFISSDNGTIGSLMAIASNIPARPGARFLSESRYMQTKLPSSALRPYETNGYETSFVYGGKLGWRGIGKYFQRQGYTHVEGENLIKEKLKLSGRVGTEWGLYDGYLFDHVMDKLKNAKRPQFILVLSTSNHPPFEVPNNFKAPGPLEIPAELKNRITREEDLFLERFKAFQYSNTVLANFISEVKESELSQNTVVSFTGDHNFWGFMSYGNEERYSKFKVPFYIYAPEDIRPKSYNKAKFGSHEDIFPTLYHLTLSDTEFVAFGDNLLGEAPSYSIGRDLFAGEEGLVYKGQSYEWKQAPNTGSKSAKSLNDLRKVYRSSISVSDFFLRHLLESGRGAQ